MMNYGEPEQHIATSSYSKVLPFSINSKLLFRGNIHTQVATLNVNMTFVGGGC